MLYFHYTEKLIDLQNLIVKNVAQDQNSTTIFAQIPRKPHNCPCCHTSTDKIHDYRKQCIKDIPAFGKSTTIVIRKRRYVCPNCGKRFYEDIPFLPRYHRMTNRLVAYVIDKLKSEYSFTSVAKNVNLSVSSVIRIFDIVAFPKPRKLPRVFAIDEFHTTVLTGGGQRAVKLPPILPNSVQGGAKRNSPVANWWFDRHKIWLKCKKSLDFKRFFLYQLYR